MKNLTKNSRRSLFRENHSKKPPIENINFLLHSAGMGDNIATLIVADYILNNFSYVNLIIYVPDYLEDFARHVLPSRAIIRNFTKGSKKYNRNLTAISNQWGVHTAMRTHPTDHAFHLMLDKHVSIEHKNYLKIRPEEIDISKYNLPEKYVCINVGSTAKPKELPPDIINTISTYCLSMGYMPVFLGKKESPVGFDKKKMVATIADIDFSKGIDLTDKTDLLECAAIISGAKCMVGMEGGLTHLAASTDTHIIASYTFVDPTIIAPVRNNIKGYNMTIITPEAKKVSCRFCQSNMSFIYDVDFKECYYDDLLCVTSLKADSFIEALEKVL